MTGARQGPVPGLSSYYRRPCNAVSVLLAVSWRRLVR